MSLTLCACVPERGLDVQLAVPAGRTLALVGPNGAGKSSLLALAGGMLRPQEGRIALAGRTLGDVREGRTRTWVPPHRRRVTTLSQDPVLFPHLTVLGNVAFALRAQGVPSRRAASRAHELLEQVGIEHLARRRPGQLSGGQAQRVAITRALAARPRLLLLDEPLAALDVDAAPQLRELLRTFLAEHTAIVVTHDVLDAVTLADSIAVLDAGRIAEVGPVQDVLTRPRTPFAARFAGLNLLAAETLGSGRADELAAFRPAAVRLLGPEEVPGPGEQVLERSVRRLEPRDDMVRVRTEDLAADVPVQQVAASGLLPGRTVRLTVPPRAVLTYPRS